MQHLTQACELNQPSRLPMLGKRLAFLRPEPPSSCLILFKYLIFVKYLKDSQQTHASNVGPCPRQKAGVG